ncbi:6708_t:CDS:1, partial [Gigaspora margarita]
MNKILVFILFAMFPIVYANPDYADCLLYNINTSIANVTFTPDPPSPLGLPLLFNYSISGISPTTTSTSLFVAFFTENSNSPFDVHVIQVPSNVTELNLTDLYVSTPILTNSYLIMFALVDDSI